MNLTVDILDDFISSLDLSGKVISSSDDGENTTLVVEKTYHIRARMNLEVDGNPYKVVSVINNEYVVVEGVLVSPSTYKVPNPFYFHGTPIMTNNHIRGANSSDKVPMVYLYEILKEKDLPINSAIKRKSDLRLFFLDSANFEDWTTDDHYSKRLLGLNNLVDVFIEQARDYSCCFYLYETEFTRINHVNWGVYEDNKGHKKRIFDDDLTGVELRFELKLKNCS